MRRLPTVAFGEGGPPQRVARYGWQATLALTECTTPIWRWRRSTSAQRKAVVSAQRSPASPRATRAPGTANPSRTSSLQSDERICGRFPDTGIAWRPLETHVEAITQLPSGELRAGAVKARSPHRGGAALTVHSSCGPSRCRTVGEDLADLVLRMPLVRIGGLAVIDPRPARKTFIPHKRQASPAGQADAVRACGQFVHATLII
jgi:hypothetical protein